MTDNDSDNDIAEQRSEMWAGELDEDSGSETDDAKNAMETKDTVGTMDAKRTEEKDKATEGDGSKSEDAMDANSTVSNSDAKDATEWDVDSIRDEWNPNSVRLPDSIQESFAAEYKRLDWLLEQTETDFRFSKDRYYKPLVIALGVQAVQEMDSEEIVDITEEMEQGELLDEQ